MTSSDPYVFVFEFDLADRLRKSLRVREMTVQEMADYLGLSRNTIGNWINGRSKPSRAQLIAWAGRVDAPLSWLETGQEPSAEQG